MYQLTYEEDTLVYSPRAFNLVHVNLHEDQRGTIILYSTQASEAVGHVGLVPASIFGGQHILLNIYLHNRWGSAHHTHGSDAFVVSVVIYSKRDYVQ